MKKNFYILFLFFSQNIYCQITTPVIKANFGVDGDLDANYFLNSISPTGGDDWFKEYPGTGIGIIDTTGAAAIVSGYTSNPATLNTTFGRGMSVIPGSIVNNKLLVNSIFVRDFHSPDSTMFASGPSKNGWSPANWNCPVAQSVPSKNDILDVMASMRRDGTTTSDSLWLFGGVSMDGTSGDRYFDFELYQTDIYFDRSTLKFYNYGPDGGHTSWKFDGAGNVIQAGDVIFSASYQSSSLSSIEARIWIDSASRSMTPVGFKWSGTFDGGGTQFGYAGIVPNTAGAFYTGLENAAPTWTGPFSSVTASNSVVTNYTSGQFMEFSVNLTKLGLDPYTLFANIGCGLSIKKLMVKSRASASFSAQLKDFVGPINFFQDFMGKATSNYPIPCGIVGPTTLKVVKPIPSIVYTWSTTNGHIVGSTTGDSIIVDSAGTYILSSAFQSGCPAFSTDTLVVPPFNINCKTLEVNIIDFAGRMSNMEAKLNWSVTQNSKVSYFEVQNSTDGVNFSSLGEVNPIFANTPTVNYDFTNELQDGVTVTTFYRIKIVEVSGGISYSKIIQLSNQNHSNLSIEIFPNPVTDISQIRIYSSMNRNIKISISDVTGRLIHIITANIFKGNSLLSIPDFEKLPDGVYSITLFSENNLLVNKMVIRKR